MAALILVRGGGDLATGTIHRLHRSGFQVLVLETDRPTAIRRSVSFCEAVYSGVARVEDVLCRRISDPSEAGAVWAAGEIPLLVDPQGCSIAALRPRVVVDAILAKTNLGTRRDMAPLTVALGPGFIAGEDVHAVIETMRGHDLGRILYEGGALPDTGVPGLIAGYADSRVIHAPDSGKIQNLAVIGDCVQCGELIAIIGDTGVPASISGVLRGIIRDGFEVKKGLKIADIDPRIEETKNCFTISDKARCIAGSVLEVVCHDLLR